MKCKRKECELNPCYMLKQVEIFIVLNGRETRISVLPSITFILNALSENKMTLV